MVASKSVTVLLTGKLVLCFATHPQPFKTYSSKMFIVKDKCCEHQTRTGMGIGQLVDL